MALRTSAHRATLQAEGDKRSEFGVYTVVSPVLQSTCDICQTWQGVVMIDDVYSDGKPDGKTPLVSTAMRAGFLHPNCRHPLVTYYPGITQIPKASPWDQTKSAYDAEQKQRYYERQIRRWKRKAALAIDPKEQERAKRMCARWQRLLKDHLETHPNLRRNYAREKVLGLTPFEKRPGDIGAMLEVAEAQKKALEQYGQGRPELHAMADRLFTDLTSEQRAILKRNDIELSREGVKQVGLVSQRIRNALKLKDENVVLTSERAAHIVKGKPLADAEILIGNMKEHVKRTKEVYIDKRSSYKKEQCLIFISKPLEDGRYPVIVIAKGVSKRKDITNSIISARIIRAQDYKRYIENEVNKHELLFSE